MPDAVRSLAQRLGAKDMPGGRAEFLQQGKLRQIGQDKWMRFSARQWIATEKCAFRWRARVGPLGAVHVEDALIDDVPVGAVRALGFIPMDNAAPSPELLKGELMRYLAELPWAPNALLCNRALQWHVEGAAQLRVEASIGSVTASVTLHLDAQGLPRAISGIRPAQEGNSFIEREWRGEFMDYRKVGGRRIPHAGKVGWMVDDAPFDVWQGRITGWNMRVA